MPLRTIHKLSFAVLALAVFLPGTRADEHPVTLKEAYGKLFDIGVALPGKGMTDAEEQLVVDQFTTLTTENCLKFDHVHPAENTFSFEQGDSLVAFAQKYHLKVNGHTLVYRQPRPDWFFDDQGKPAARDLVLSRMRKHIAVVAGHYKGKLDNNDYGIEIPSKREKALRLVRDLRDHGARVDGIGIQGHWETGKVPCQDIEDAIVAFHQAGLEVMITELDLDVVPRKIKGADASKTETTMSDPYANGCPPEILQQQASDYAKLFRLFRKHADKITRVTFWNLHDGRSWLNSWPRKRTNHPLLWDRQLQPKPAFATVMAVAAEPPPAK